MQLGKGINKLVDRYREDFFNDSLYLSGYNAIINYYKLLVPNPHSMVLISDSKSATSSNCYKVYRTRYLPEDNVYSHLKFSLKYEGVDLLVLKALFEKLSKAEVTELVTYKQTGQYSRRLWFLYEWLTQAKLDIDDLDSKSKYVHAIDTSIQFAIAGQKSKRHLVLNNLPGVEGYCPLVRKTDNILRQISQKYSDKLKASISGLKQDILYRAAAYITLKDSQSSFNIEGETPPQNKAQRWARAIGQAGQNNLTQKEIERLQTIILGSDERFINFGYRNVIFDI